MAREELPLDTLISQAFGHSFGVIGATVGVDLLQTLCTAKVAEVAFDPTGAAVAGMMSLSMMAIGSWLAWGREYGKEFRRKRSLAALTRPRGQDRRRRP